MYLLFLKICIYYFKFMHLIYGFILFELCLLCLNSSIYSIHVYIYVCGRKKYLNCTLEIDSPFQTLTVGLLVEFID